MSLREKLNADSGTPTAPDLYRRFGVLSNPFPASNQTSNNPHLPSSADTEVESRIVSFLRDDKSQVVVIEGTQGVGKTNLLNHFETDIQEALSDRDGYYVVRYLADPEKSFDGTIRRLFQELGVDHIKTLATELSKNRAAIDVVRGNDMRSALTAISQSVGDEQACVALCKSFMEWLLGFRLLKAHREGLLVQFRLDTVESKTSALRDIIVVSNSLNILKGIFLLLDEIEKQDGVLGPTAVVRYLSAMRAIIDALPSHLFMMLAVTPDAMRRYSSALPAFRSRLQNQITLHPLQNVDEGIELARFYLNNAATEARRLRGDEPPGEQALVAEREVAQLFQRIEKSAERRGETGVRQREFLHNLHIMAEQMIESATPKRSKT